MLHNEVANKRVRAIVLGEILGVAHQSIAALVRRGIIDRGEDGLYDVDECKARILASVGPSGKTAKKLMNEERPDTEAANYQESRALREAAEAAIAQIKLAELRGEVIRLDAIRSTWAAKISSVRDGILQIPARVAPRLAAESDLVAITTMLEIELRQVLGQLSAPDKT